MELPAVLVFSYFFLTGHQEKTLVAWSFLTFWLFHYLHRSIIFPFRQKTKGKRMPIVIMLSAIFFNFVNGYLNGHYLGSLSFYSLSWFYDARFIGGFTVLIIGLAINWHSDTILINLRNPDEQGYKIPYGGLFQRVSCPNYLGEIIEWSGFALMTWSLPALSFVLWTMANLVPRALAHHKWYHQTFEDYPKERKAIIPFVL